MAFWESMVRGLEEGSGVHSFSFVFIGFRLLRSKQCFLSFLWLLIIWLFFWRPSARWDLINDWLPTAIFIFTFWRLFLSVVIAHRRTPELRFLSMRPYFICCSSFQQYSILFLHCLSGFWCDFHFILSQQSQSAHCLSFFSYFWVACATAVSTIFVGFDCLASLHVVDFLKELVVEIICCLFWLTNIIKTELFVILRAIWTSCLKYGLKQLLTC